MVKRLKRSVPLLAGVTREQVEALLERVKVNASAEEYEALRRMAETVLTVRDGSDDEVRALMARVRRERRR